LTVPTTSVSGSNINIGLIGGIIGSVILVLLLLIWIKLYRKPWSINEIYSRMVFLASLSGIGPKPWQTALEFSNQLSLALPGQSPAINGIVQAYVVTKYSDGLSMKVDAALQGSWQELRGVLWKYIFKRPFKRRFIRS
jgi:hypothetical protein